MTLKEYKDSIPKEIIENKRCRKAHLPEYNKIVHTLSKRYHLSSVRIGIILNRDHTTILNTLKKPIEIEPIEIEPIEIEPIVKKEKPPYQKMPLLPQMTKKEKQFYDIYGKVPTENEMKQFIKNREVRIPSTWQILGWRGLKDRRIKKENK